MTLEQIADALEAAGISSPYSTDYDAANAWQKAHPGERVSYDDHRMINRLNLDTSQLPERWQGDVHDILTNRRIAVLEAEADALFEQLPEPLRTVAQTKRRQRTQKPEARDLSRLWKGSNSRGTRVVDAYKPDSRCGLRLKLKDAVHIDYEQASYADHSRYVIPVEGERPADLRSCQTNLARFCEAIHTTNGLAGFGSSWNMELIDTPTGFVVYADCRSSIAD